MRKQVNTMYSSEKVGPLDSAPANHSSNTPACASTAWHIFSISDGCALAIISARTRSSLAPNCSARGIKTRKASGIFLALSLITGRASDVRPYFARISPAGRISKSSLRIVSPWQADIEHPETLPPPHPKSSASRLSVRRRAPILPRGFRHLRRLHPWPQSPAPSEQNPIPCKIRIPLSPGTSPWASKPHSPKAS